MGKYVPLKAYLETQGRDHVPMTFAEIERVIGEPLPASKQYPAWWSNNPSNNVMTREWLAAGYQTESVDISGEKLVFRRVKPAGAAGVVRAFGTSDPSGGNGQGTVRHPIYGCLAGTITIMPGVDLTEPADPDWAKVYED
jgi:hypothetical protein